MAELLYYKDPNQFEFDAAVVSVQEEQNRWKVVLDCTCFYPEGGGQPADLGTIQGVEVLDVQKRDGEVIHLLKSDPGRGTVHAALDVERRRDYMQQHTGQHVISAALIDVGDFSTVSVHQGDEYTTIEIGDSEISPDALAAVESMANEIIGRNLPVRTHWVGDKDLHKYPLRRPSKVSGKIRLVEIEDTDWVACGGVHTDRTGAVGLVKAVGVESIRGHARIAWKIGKRAYEDYARKEEMVSELVSRFSARPDEIVEKVDQALEKVREAEFRTRGLAERVAGFEAERLIAGADAHGVVAARYDDEEKGFLLSVMKIIMEHGGLSACLVNVQDERVQWCIGGESVDFTTVKSELLSLIGGKGGGKPPVWQGVGTVPDGIPAMFSAFVQQMGRS